MWEEKDNSLQKTFTFKNFNEAWAWMTRAALAAEKMDHHPEWTNVYNRVVVKLSTHDAGNTVTDKDRKLAEAMDRFAGQ
jgi:4a-hydroxytetrahydrobiopterin dehydratase